MLFKCRVTHVLWVIWDAEFDGDIYVLILARGNVKFRSNYVKLGHISNLKIFLQNAPILCSFTSVYQKYHLFLSTTNTNATNCIRKYDVITFTWFYGHCRTKTEDIALEFCMRVVCMYLDHSYSVFLINGKFFILKTNIFEILKFYFSWVKIEIYQKSGIVIM